MAGSSVTMDWFGSSRSVSAQFYRCPVRVGFGGCDVGRATIWQRRARRCSVIRIRVLLSAGELVSLHLGWTAQSDGALAWHGWAILRDSFAGSSGRAVGGSAFGEYGAGSSSH